MLALNAMPLAQSLPGCSAHAAVMHILLSEDAQCSTASQVRGVLTGTLQSMPPAHLVEATAEGAGLAPYGGDQQVLHVRVHIGAPVQDADGHAAPALAQVHRGRPLPKLGRLLHLCPETSRTRGQAVAAHRCTPSTAPLSASYTATAGLHAACIRLLNSWPWATAYVDYMAR